MSPELEGAELFDAAAKAIGFNADRTAWTAGRVWSLLVPDMLEWLGRRAIAIWKWSDGGYSIKITDGSSSTGPDLPTALARLVLRVAELEGKS